MITITTLDTINGDRIGTESVVYSLPDDPRIACLSWSPDGTTLAFRRRGFDLTTLNLATGNETTFVNTAGGLLLQQCLAFSPVRSEVAYMSNRDIYLYNFDNGSNTNLTNSLEIDEFELAWSPDGERIAFITNDETSEGNYDVFDISREGGVIRQISQGGDDYHPTWSPDGGRIAFNRRASETGSGIVVVDLNGELPSAGTVVGGAGFGLQQDAVWSPDGAWIAFEDATGDDTMYLISPDGGQLYPIETSAAGVGRPRWQPWEPVPWEVTIDPSATIPTLIGDYDSCPQPGELGFNNPEFRGDCAVETLLQKTPLTWQDLVAYTIEAEGGTTIMNAGFTASEGVCWYNLGRGTSANFMSGVTYCSGYSQPGLQRDFVRAVVYQLHRLCWRRADSSGLPENTCNEANLIDYLAGLEVWYSDASLDDSTSFAAQASDMMTLFTSDIEDYAFCPCSWGNPDSTLTEAQIRRARNPNAPREWVYSYFDFNPPLAGGGWFIVE